MVAGPADAVAGLELNFLAPVHLGPARPRGDTPRLPVDHPPVLGGEHSEPEAQSTHVMRNSSPFATSSRL